MATWLAMEFYRPESPGDVAIKLTPAAQGRLEVYLDGEKIFDRLKEGSEYPNSAKALELKMAIAEKIFEVDEALATS